MQFGYPLATAVMLALSQYMIWFYAPIEETMGEVQKIFYVHMPMAWWSLVSFFVVFLASIGFLLTRESRWDRTAAAAAEVGVLLSGLALVTGALWGRPVWNVWWTWDPRLTTTLIMWFVYMGYLLLRASDEGGERRPAVSAVLGIVAFLDVPLVFLSARWWRSIHPAVLGSKTGGMDQDMWYAMVVSLAAWGLLWGGLLRLRAGQMALSAKISARMALEDDL